MYVGMTRARTHLRILFAQSRFLWGDRQTNAPSRFLDDLPDTAIERRSDDVLSAFAWASDRGSEKARSNQRIEPFRQELNMEFNQDLSSTDTESQEAELDTGARVEHPVFGKGTVTGKRGDVVDIYFDSGKKKTLALSIAPLKVL